MEPVTVTRHESALGVWTSAVWTPPAGSPLSGAIARVWYFDGALHAARERVFPDGTLELVVQLDTPHRPGTDEPVPRFPPVCATGLRTTAEIVEAPYGRCRVLGVRLEPQAAFALLGQALPDVSSRTIDLHDAIGAAAAELGTRIHDARDAADAIRAAAAWTERRLANGPEADATVRRLLHAIASGGGADALDALDAWRGRSRARFVAAFRDRVGVSPKRFARIVRFERALRAVGERRASLGEIALACGYYDQAHFTNEFREHAGMTPRAYLRAAAYPGTTHVADAAEQNFQDAAAHPA